MSQISTSHLRIEMSILREIIDIMTHLTFNTTTATEASPQIVTRAKLKKLKHYLMVPQVLIQVHALTTDINQQQERLKAYRRVNRHSKRRTPTERHLQFKIGIQKRVLCKFYMFLKIIIRTLKQKTPMLQPQTYHHYKELTKTFHSTQ